MNAARAVDGTLVVVGASLAGWRAVQAARRAGFTGPVRLIGDEPVGPYERPPLSKGVLTGDRDPGSLALAEADAAASLDVDLVIGRAAVGLDTAGREVRLSDETSVWYDRLIIATGARPFWPDSLRGAAGLGGVHQLRTVRDAIALREELQPGARVVVVGAGLVGGEVASSARSLGCEVTVLERDDVGWRRPLGAELGPVLSRLHQDAGVDLRCGVDVVALQGADHVTAVRLGDGATLPADVVVVGTGSRPTTGWLDGSGLQCADGIVCDEHLATGDPQVHAAGDVVRWTNGWNGRSSRGESWTCAGEQAAVAARNAVLAGPPESCSIVPYLWSDQHGTRVQAWGAAVPEGETYVLGDVAGRRFVALQRDGDVAGLAAAFDRPDVIMKLRPVIARRAPWDEAIAHVRSLVS